MPKLIAFVLTLSLLIILDACGSSSTQIVQMPTLAVLPSATPQPTNTPVPTNTPTATPTSTPTHTPSPTATATPNRIETQLVQLQATNDAALATLVALLTRNAPTSTPSDTATASATNTSTPTSSDISPLTFDLEPQLIYAQSAANLRDCPARSCDVVAQLERGEAVMATGIIEGEALTNGNTLWYRVDRLGQQLYVYSQLVAGSPPPPPTFVPTAVPAPTTAPINVPTPISIPPSSGNCPDVKASCSELTCEQAYACLAAGDKSLDRDKDGIPCESICS